MLLIGGITPFSTVDWPGKLSCVAFLAGCMLNCPYCHNSSLRSMSNYRYGWTDLKMLLDERVGKLEAVVFSGGEPLLQSWGLPYAMSYAKNLGYEVGLHTSGVLPHKLSALLDEKLVDWVGIDAKWPLVRPVADDVIESIENVVLSGIEYEVRTTWHPDVLYTDDIRKIASDLAGLGVRKYVIQAYRHFEGSELRNVTVTEEDVPEEVRNMFDDFSFRT